MKIAIYLILSYLIGSIPFAYIIAKIFKKVDIRTLGSGNPGATNVFRISKPLGIFTFFCDVLKGFVPVYIASLIFPAYILIFVALAAILGHVYTVFLNFKGGKGVATGCGAFFAINPLATSVCLAVFIVFLAIFKYISLGSIMAAIVLPVSLYIFNSETEIIVFAAAVSVLVILRHLSNIKRILSGTENKI